MRRLTLLLITSVRARVPMKPPSVTAPLLTMPLRRLSSPVSVTPSFISSETALLLFGGEWPEEKLWKEQRIVLIFFKFVNESATF